MNIRAKISIHAPHAGRDGAASPRVSVAWIFQSTRPMRGATGARQFKTRRYQHFNPRAPCGARRNQRRRHAFTTLFQSTRPMRGATPLPPQPKTAKMRFQSTRPMRGATTCKVLQAFAWDISIHAPHAGRDIRAINHVVYKFDFNPRAPCGARRLSPGCSSPFQFISIHAPHAGRDLLSLINSWLHRNFNPRAPCGARLFACPN